jgi:hypothetical protein
METQELKIPTIRSIKMLLEPILFRLDNIENSLKKTPPVNNSKKYYRNNDLRNIFGISPNTIIKYRENGTIPYTRLGDVYLYEVKVIHSILEQNSVK